MPSVERCKPEKAFITLLVSFWLFSVKRASKVVVSILGIGQPVSTDEVVSLSHPRRGSRNFSRGGDGLNILSSFFLGRPNRFSEHSLITVKTPF